MALSNIINPMTITASTTLTNWGGNIVCNSASPIVITLAKALAGNISQTLKVKNIGAGVVSFLPSAGDTITEVITVEQGKSTELFVKDTGIVDAQYKVNTSVESGSSVVQNTTYHTLATDYTVLSTDQTIVFTDDTQLVINLPAANVVKRKLTLVNQSDGNKYTDVTFKDLAGNDIDLIKDNQSISIESDGVGVWNLVDSASFNTSGISWIDAGGFTPNPMNPFGNIPQKLDAGGSPQIYTFNSSGPVSFDGVSVVSVAKGEIAQWMPNLNDWNRSNKLIPTFIGATQTTTGIEGVVPNLQTNERFKSLTGQSQWKFPYEFVDTYPAPYMNIINGGQGVRLKAGELYEFNAESAYRGGIRAIPETTWDLAPIPTATTVGGNPWTVTGQPTSGNQECFVYANYDTFVWEYKVGGGSGSVVDEVKFSSANSHYTILPTDTTVIRQATSTKNIVFPDPSLGFRTLTILNQSGFPQNLTGVTSPSFLEFDGTGITQITPYTGYVFKTDGSNMWIATNKTRLELPNQNISTVGQVLTSQGTAGTETWETINTGQTLTYARVRANADLASISYAITGAGTPVNFDATQYSSGMTFTGTNGIVPSVTGRYRASWLAMCGSGEFNGDGTFHIVQNGVSVASVFVDIMQAAGVNQLAPFVDVDLVAGQPVTINFQPVIADSIPWGKGSYFQLTQIGNFINTVLNTMVGANGTVAGETGSVPAPLATDNTKYLRGDGTWATVLGVIIGDAKSGFQSTDHNGWIKLDGRLKSTLTATQQANATALGIGANLPDATGRSFRQGTLLASIGSDLITQPNLPNVTLTTVAGGSHSHTYLAANGSLGQGVGTGGRNAGEISILQNTQSTGAAAAHTHTVALNGGVTQTAYTPASIGCNMFVYLGI
jgi:hypothetical protein